jgi:hypothetical protein
MEGRELKLAHAAGSTEEGMLMPMDTHMPLVRQAGRITAFAVPCGIKQELGALRPWHIPEQKNKEHGGSRDGEGGVRGGNEQPNATQSPWAARLPGPASY